LRPTRVLVYSFRVMEFSDLNLSRRLERAEGRSCREFAATRRRLSPDSDAAWIECAGAYAVFDGVDSPVTQSFGLGLFEPLSPASLDTIEDFFRSRGAAVVHEVSPLAGVAALDLLCTRGYRPIELSSVLRRPVEAPAGKDDGRITVRVAGVEDLALWAQVSARGWANGQPELRDFIESFGKVTFLCEGSVNFIAELDGEPGAAGKLCLHEGIALFGGAATIPELRRHGLQAALLEARLRYAFEQGCDLAMMVTEAGSQSQRNAERKDFRIAYTRTKWRLSPS
jgi:GNAT superfamily N-acetyltransferase